MRYRAVYDRDKSRGYNNIRLRMSHNVYLVSHNIVEFSR